jgi:hypothetical protein
MHFATLCGVRVRRVRDRVRVRAEWVRVRVGLE